MKLFFTSLLDAIVSHFLCFHLCIFRSTSSHQVFKKLCFLKFFFDFSSIYKPSCIFDACMVLSVWVGHVLSLLASSFRILTSLMKSNACQLQKLGFWLPNQILISPKWSTLMLLLFTREKYYFYTKFLQLYIFRVCGLEFRI